MHSLDSTQMSITCPTCHKTVKNTVGWFRRSSQKCPYGCGTTFNTEGQFREGVAKAEKEIDKFTSKFKNIKININL